MKRNERQIDPEKEMSKAKKKELIERLLSVREKLWSELDKNNLAREETEKRMWKAYKEIIALAEILVFKHDVAVKVMKSGSIRIY